MSAKPFSPVEPQHPVAGRRCEVLHSQSLERVYSGRAICIGQDHEDFGDHGPAPFPVVVVERDDDGRLDPVYAKHVRLLGEEDDRDSAIAEVVREAFRSRGWLVLCSVRSDLIDIVCGGFGTTVTIRGELVTIGSLEVAYGMPWTRWLDLTHREVAERSVDPDLWPVLKAAINEVMFSLQTAEILQSFGGGDEPPADPEVPAVEYAEQPEEDRLESSLEVAQEATQQASECLVKAGPVEARHRGVSRDEVLFAFSRIDEDPEVEVSERQINLYFECTTVRIRGYAVTVLDADRNERSQVWSEWQKAVSKQLLNYGIDPAWWSRVKPAIQEIIGLFRIEQYMQGGVA